MIPSDYAREAAEVQRSRDNTPRATALLTRVHEAEGELLDPEQRKSLEAIALALALHQQYREDLTVAGELHYSKRLQRIAGKAAE